MPKQPPARPVDDGDLFDTLLSDVTPLPAHGRVVHLPAPRKPLPGQRDGDERVARADSLSDHIAWEVGTETGDELLYRRGGISPQTLKRLRRGHWIIEAELDLHGCTRVVAHEMLVAFLNECQRENARCVRIVHGKGLRSKNRAPVLKTRVANWLMQRDEVLAFCQARLVDGGGGAVMVLLKSVTKGR